MNGSRLGFYEPMKPVIGSFIPDTSPILHWLRNVTCGAITGAIGAGIGSPFFLVKTRLQAASSSSNAVGDQHSYKGMFDGFSKIISQDGVFGLWRGASASITRVMVGSATQLSTYDLLKTKLQSNYGITEGIGLSAASSFATGIFVCFAMNPFDVISTRLYNQKSSSGKGTRYNGFFDCIVKTFKSEGPFAFYKGLTAHYFRIGPHTLLTFIFYEEYKRIAISYGFL